MKRIFLSVLAVAASFSGVAQPVVTIPRIQGSGSTTTFSGSTITTTGVVTAKFIGDDMINGFFLQDKTGDGNPETSDGIFVYTTLDQVSVGDEVSLTATVGEYYGRTQLSDISNLAVLGSGNALSAQKITYLPGTWNWERYEGMLVEFEQTLWVTGNTNLDRYGQLELSTTRRPIPTNVAFPLTDHYFELLNANAQPPLVLDDGCNASYKTPISFADRTGTRRTGERVDRLQAVVDYAYGRYTIYPSQLPVPFYGNPRKETHDDIGRYDLKVCGFNLEYYLTTPNSSLGPSTQEELGRQHIKLLETMLAIDADIYGLVEIEQGQQALTKLAAAMNTAKGFNSVYTFVNDQTSVQGAYTKAAYLYRSDKVTPYNTLVNINQPTPVHRKKLQAFTVRATGERFIFSINHFKAKSGCPSTGQDADQSDGQGCFNATRKREAEAVINSIQANKGRYDTEAVLVMGDLNAYAKEDPITAFVSAGYTDLHSHFHADSAYSYVFRSETGYLDHALVNDALLPKVTGVTAFHINADEPTIFGYDGANYSPDMFRSSDHDPVVVGLRFGTLNGDSTLDDERVRITTYVSGDDLLRIFDAENHLMQLYSASGIKLLQQQIPSASFELKPKASLGLVAGVYVVRVLGEGRIVQRLIVVN